MTLEQGFLDSVPYLWKIAKREDKLSSAPEDLISETYLRAKSAKDLDKDFDQYESEHARCLFARLLRRTATDQARKDRSEKNHIAFIDFDFSTASCKSPHFFTYLDEALDRLMKVDSRAAKVVDLKFFGGWTDDEVASKLDVPFSTVRRDWEFAKDFLYRVLS